MGKIVPFPVQADPGTADNGEPGPLSTFYLPLPDGGPLDPRTHCAKVVEENARFSHLDQGEAVVMFAMRSVPKIKANRQILGSIHLPRFQGGMGDFALWLLAMACQGNMPDYLMILDAEFWINATPVQREALMFHELCHTVHETDKEGELKFTDEGRPVFGIQGHDIEEFNDVVAKYGAWLPDVTAFVDALRTGGAV